MNESSRVSNMHIGSNRFLYISLGVVVVFFTVILVVIWRLGFFDFTGTDASSTVVAAAVALIGTILTAVVSVIGILIKHSFDRQALIRQEMEAHRNEELKREAEQRLKLEAATGVLKLLSTSEGKPTPDIQRDGALFTLANLGQYQLTLELADSLLDKEDLSAGTASNLISNAILKADENEKIQAICILYYHPKAMLTPEGADIPECLLDWVPGLSDYVREWSVYAIAEILLARTLSEWLEECTYQTLGIIGTVCVAWEREQETKIKKRIGAILKALLEALNTCGVIGLPNKEINLHKIRDEIKECVADGYPCIDIVERIEKWPIKVTPQKRRKKAVAKRK